MNSALGYLRFLPFLGERVGVRAVGKLLVAAFLLLLCSAPAALAQNRVRAGSLPTTNSLAWSNKIVVVVFPYPHPESTNANGAGGEYQISITNLLEVLKAQPNWTGGVGGGDAGGTNARLFAIAGTASNLTAISSGIDQVPFAIRSQPGQDSNLFNVLDGSGAVVFGLAYDGSMFGEGLNSPRLTSTATAGYVWTAVGTTGIGTWSAVEVTTAILNAALALKQNLDAELSALAGLTSAADKLPYFNGSGTAALTDFTGAARNLLDDANTTTMRATLGLVIGTDVQAFDSDLANIAALATTAFGRGLLDDADAAAGRSSLGVVIGTDVQAFDSDLANIAALTTTAFGRGLLDDADATAGRASLGVVIGTDVQAWDQDLQNFAGTGGVTNIIPGWGIALVTNAGITSIVQTNRPASIATNATGVTVGFSDVENVNTYNAWFHLTTNLVVSPTNLIVGRTICVRFDTNALTYDVAVTNTAANPVNWNINVQTNGSTSFTKTNSLRARLYLTAETNGVISADFGYYR